MDKIQTVRSLNPRPYDSGRLLWLSMPCAALWWTARSMAKSRFCRQYPRHKLEKTPDWSAAGHGHAQVRQILDLDGCGFRIRIRRFGAAEAKPVI
jgi:hypothetical protein